VTLELASAQGVEIDEVFAETVPPPLARKIGVEGMQRPMLLRMLERVHSGAVQVVIVSNYRSLASQVAQQEVIRVYLSTIGVSVLAVDGDPEDMTQSFSPAPRYYVRQALETYLELSKRYIGCRLRAARLTKRLAGTAREGQKPYGHRPGEVSVLREIYRLRDDGLTISRIAQYLNASGIMPRRGATWFPNTIRRILDRPRPRVLESDDDHRARLNQESMKINSGMGMKD
jgi:DNA invertase Pin-like site-specific DNA recombinase